MSESLAASAVAKTRVARISFAVTVGLFVFKLVVGIHTRSLGILADATHTALDIVATLMTWLSLSIAARPADANHPFGHGKFENFSAFLETGLLVAAAVVIAVEATRRWLTPAAAVHLDVWAFVVMATSMAVDWRRAAMLRRAARQYHSDALAADALNFSTDLAGSAAVLIGLGLVAAGRAWNVSILEHADTAAALVVATAMVLMAVRLARRTVGGLLDEASPALAGELRRALAEVAGVRGLERLRLRSAGPRHFVDLELVLDAPSTLEHANLIRQRAGERVRELLPNADVVIEIRPPRPAGGGAFEQVQAVARRQNLNIHDLLIYQVAAQGAEPALDVEFHLEVPAALPLAEAHSRVSALETEMRRQVPAIRQIVTHIEPETMRIDTANLLEPERVARQVEEIARQWPEMLDCHDIQLRSSNGHLGLSLHCSFADQLPVGRVHEVLSQVEAEIKRALPELQRVTLHPEPRSDNR